jgi:hypothetical protein
LPLGYISPVAVPPGPGRAGFKKISEAQNSVKNHKDDIKEDKIFSNLGQKIIKIIHLKKILF